MMDDVPVTVMVWFGFDASNGLEALEFPGTVPRTE